MQFSITYKRLAQALLIVGPLASLAVSPTSNYDPINLIKILFISSIAFFCFGLILSSFKYSMNRLSKKFWILVSLFILSMISTLFLSGAPFTQQIWGSFGRNTGFLTYFSLLMILISTALIQETLFYHKIVHVLLFTALPMTAYCLVQYAGLDPVGWSEKHPFGTLGNINFSSAFFGISSICAVALIFERKFSITLRIGLGFLVAVDMFIVLSTGSIQGFMIFIAGTGLLIYLYMRSNIKYRLIKIPYVLLSIFGVAITIFGLSNKGPLAKFLFAPSILFRTDYWHAGWVMTLEHPFFGVGLDSYGDWYRSSRGLLSTIRTGPGRIANTAHNIFLDISSNGGIPLITAYILINFIAFRAATRVLKRDTQFRPYFAALFATWFGYLIFSAISINQVGVGIWGWIFTGAIIGYEIATRQPDKSDYANRGNVKSRNKGGVLPASAGIFAFIGITIGFVLAYIPFNADMKYKTALQTADLTKIVESTKVIGSTAFHLESALDLAVKNNFASPARDLTIRLTTEYPLDYMGWKALYVLASSSQEEKANAVNKLNQLDPFNKENTAP